MKKNAKKESAKSHSAEQTSKPKTGRKSESHPLLGLQQAAGNQAVARMLRDKIGRAGSSGNRGEAKSATTAEDSKIDELGGPLTTLGDLLPQTRGSSAAQAQVKPSSPVADQRQANAVTLGNKVHLSSKLERMEAPEQRRVLAHEAVHVAQQSSGSGSASRPELEMEAHGLAPQVLAGHTVQPGLHASPAMALADVEPQLPGDKIAVERAKKRREELLRLKAIFDKGGGESGIVAEREKIRQRRHRLDESMATMLAAVEQRSKQKGRAKEEYPAQEGRHLAKLNRKPLSIDVTPTAVKIKVRFQVRFEGKTDKEAAAQFTVLERNLRKGIKDTWDQTLPESILAGRTFELVPEIKLVSATAPRDTNFWLITVRPSDKGPMLYEKQNLGTAPGGVPTSATDPTVDGGVMSIPPSHITNAETLGHETLHLFGMVDRYAIIPAALSPTNQQEDVPLRDTRGRPDPLGGEGGKILEEDLGFVLEEFGAYPTMTHSEVLLELRRLDEIIRTGRDPNSLIRRKKDFTEEMIKQTEDL